MRFLCAKRRSKFQSKLPIRLQIFPQVTVLTEQVGAQKEKIRDLETQLESKRNKLESAEELLHDVVGVASDSHPQSR